MKFLKSIYYEKYTKKSYAISNVDLIIDRIFANNSTLTGSIGVFGIVPNTKKFLNEKLGIYIETVKTHKHSDLGIGYRRLSDEEVSVIQNSVEDIYKTFIRCSSQ